MRQGIGCNSMREVMQMSRYVVDACPWGFAIIGCHYSMENLVGRHCNMTCMLVIVKGCSYARNRTKVNDELSVVSFVGCIKNWAIVALCGLTIVTIGTRDSSNVVPKLMFDFIVQ